MAIHLVIDGYNLIGAEAGLSGKLEEKRDQLIALLRQYQAKKDYPITVVFDGWRSGSMDEVEENRGGIRVIFSRLGEKADSVIERLSEEMGAQCVVVSSDREVQKAAEGNGAVAIFAGAFSRKLKEVDREGFIEGPRSEESRDRRKIGNPRRLSKIERKRRERFKKL